MTMNLSFITDLTVYKKYLCTVYTNYCIIDENYWYNQDEGITNNCY